MGRRFVTSRRIVLTKFSGGRCRCRLVKMGRPGATVTGLCGGFDILPLGGEVAVLGGGEAGGTEGIGCLTLIPVTTNLLLLGGVSTVTHILGRGMTRIVRRPATLTAAAISGVRTTGPLPPRGSGVCSAYSVVPRFPNKRGTLLRFLTGGVGCPARTRRRKGRKGMIIAFIVRGSKDVAGTGIARTLCPSLSRRSLQVIGSVPG